MSKLSYFYKIIELYKYKLSRVTAISNFRRSPIKDNRCKVDVEFNKVIKVASGTRLSNEWNNWVWLDSGNEVANDLAKALTTYSNKNV